MSRDNSAKHSQRNGFGTHAGKLPRGEYVDPEPEDGYPLNMRKDKDRRLLHRALSQGWGVDRDHLKHYRMVLDETLEDARRAGQTKYVLSAIRLMIAIVDQVQKDEHAAKGVGEKLNITINFNG